VVNWAEKDDPHVMSNVVSVSLCLRCSLKVNPGISLPRRPCERGPETGSLQLLLERCYVGAAVEVGDADCIWKFGTEKGSR